MVNLSVTIPIAYDWRMATGRLLPAILPHLVEGDEILLGVDKDRLTWSNQPFDFDFLKFGNTVSNLVGGHLTRITRIVNEDFHHFPHPMLNDTLEHNLLSLHAARENAIVHLDADEIPTDPAKTLGAVRSFYSKDPPKSHLYDLRVLNVQVYKELPNDRLLVIDQSDFSGYGPLATMKRGAYQASRETDHNDLFRVFATPRVAGTILHYGWSRSPKELERKLKNWSHARDGDWHPFFQLWLDVNDNNYHQPQYRNFWPLRSQNWPALRLVRRDELTQLWQKQDESDATPDTPEQPKLEHAAA